MGGCRCTFRQCENSSSSKPGMHFFHFPIRDWPRLKTWAQNAGKVEFTSLPLNKLKNKVVCQDHFENRMFMNYLKEGLVKTAVPTLEALQDGSVRNVETNEVGEREEWLILEKDQTSSNEVDSIDVAPVEPETTRMEIQFVDSEHEEFNITPVVSPPPHPKILNKASEVVPVRLLSRITNEPIKTPPSSPIVLRKVMVKRKRAASRDESPSKVQIVSIQRLPKTKELAAEELPSAATPSSSTDVTTGDPMVENLVQPSSPAASPPAPPPNVTPTIKIITDPVYIEKLDHASTQIAEVKQLLTDVLNRPVPEPKVITVPVPTPAEPVAAQPVPPPAEETLTKLEKGPYMNKVQLFNGIKRYLNPTMVALLRMELFAGAPERQWKADEKTLAVELVNLDEKVYTHFLDEFRFRLPAKKDVLKWKEEAMDDDDDAS